MATKDDCVSSKDKRNHFASKDQRNNLNLTDHFQPFFKETFPSKNVTTGYKKIQNYDLKNDDCLRTKIGSHSSWKQQKLFMNNDDRDIEKKDKFKKSKCPSNDNSTLSIHIANYEAAVEDPDGGKKDAFTMKDSSFIKKWETLKSVGLSKQNPFEFPRQQENEEAKTSEIAQFKASQKLLIPNKMNAKCLTIKGEKAQKVKLEQKAKEKASKENEKPCEVPYLLPWLNPNYPLTVPVQQSDCEWGQWISVDADNQCHRNRLSLSPYSISHVNRDAADLSPPQSYHSLNDFDDPLEAHESLVPYDISSEESISDTGDYKDGKGYSPLFPRSYCTPPFTGSPASSLSSVESRIEYIKPKWAFKLPLKPYSKKDEDLSSLSGCDVSSESEEEQLSEVEPQVYKDVSSVVEKFSKLVINKQVELLESTKAYWSYVRKLKKQRDEMVKVLTNQLNKEKVFNDDNLLRLNAKIRKVAHYLNFLVPVYPAMKVQYASSSNKTVIIRKGFIYQRFEETEWFGCTYNFDNGKACCQAWLRVDNSDSLIDGTFPFHNHSGTCEFIPDEPLPQATPTFIPKAESSAGYEYGPFRQLMMLLDKTENDLKAWNEQAELCRVKWEYLKALASEVEEMSPLTNLCDLKNLLNGIRLDKVKFLI